jgi:hypothetical protein
LQERLCSADLAAFNEFSMLGQAFICKILFRAKDAQPDATRGSLFGLGAILAGHLAQAAPIGDDPVYKNDSYTGKGLHKPTGDYTGPPPPSYESFVQDARLFLDEFEDVALLLETHRVDEEGGKSWSAERLAQYQRDTKRFLEVTRRVADVEWTRKDWHSLARRNASALFATAEGGA